MRVRISFLVTTILITWAAAGSAAPATPGLEVFLTGLEATPLAERVQVSKGDALLAVCTARCANGSTKTVTSSGQCSAVDAACPGQQGYVRDDVTGVTTYCPPCPCVVTASCLNGSTQSCASFSNDCWAVDNCFAYCDGVYHWCPTPLPRWGCPY